MVNRMAHTCAELLWLPPTHYSSVEKPPKKDTYDVCITRIMCILCIRREWAAAAASWVECSAGWRFVVVFSQIHRWAPFGARVMSTQDKHTTRRANLHLSCYENSQMGNGLIYLDGARWRCRCGGPYICFFCEFIIRGLTRTRIRLFRQGAVSWEFF